jgi:hypothetical protein
MNTRFLETALLDLLLELDGTEIDLIIGGGYGILLRINERRKSGVRTLYSSWPQERTTGDIDLFLRPELLINSKQLKPLQAAFDKLGYRPVESAKYYQFEKTVTELSSSAKLKFDLLTGPERNFQGTTVKTDGRRAKPRRPKIDIHAHTTNEAITLEEALQKVEITGVSREGQSVSASVFLPNAFTFLMMKMYAFKDRYQEIDKEFGIYHALDMYSILATTTEEEWASANKMRDRFAEDTYFIEAVSIVDALFTSSFSIGIVRLKESSYFRDDFEVDKFITNLRELFHLG